MKKRLFNVLALLTLTLTLVLTGCSGSEDPSTTQAGSTEDYTTEDQSTDTQADDMTDDVTPEVTEDTSAPVPALSHIASLNDVDYIVMKTRSVDASEYEVDADEKAILVTMTVSNRSSNFVTVSPYMGFEFFDESGEDQSGVEAYESVSEHTLSGLVGPGKVLSGDCLVIVDQGAETITLEVLESIMSDNSAKLSFQADQVYEETAYASNDEGKKLGDSFEDTDLSYQVTSITRSQDDEDELITIHVIASNHTDGDIDSYEIPFQLVDVFGYTCDLSYKMDNYTFAGIPANGTKEADVIYVAETPGALTYDIYYAPFGAKDVEDLIHMPIAE